jgi:wyosine [tRNA(Phe)-imidazoG37] synthetase (radical SAM superfamily)
VSKKLEKSYVEELPVDYLTFVPTGEPALDENLGSAIKLLRSLGVKIAIISNSSLLTRPDVRKDFLLADFVSLKIDSLKCETWHRLNRPDPQLEFREILQGIQDFKKIYRGKLVTETMFVKDFNDKIEEARSLADFIGKLQPDIAYLAFPIRPPAERWIEIPDESDIVKFHQIFQDKIKNVEYLIDYEGSDIGFDSHDVKTSILEITRVHPIREDALKNMLDEAREKEHIINEMVIKKQIIKAHYKGETFYVGRILNK